MVLMQTINVGYFQLEKSIVGGIYKVDQRNQGDQLYREVMNELNITLKRKNEWSSVVSVAVTKL